MKQEIKSLWLDMLMWLEDRFIIDKTKDIIHFILRKSPLWGDAKCCGNLFCRFCGGKIKKT